MKYTNVINGKLLKVENIYSNSHQRPHYECNHDLLAL
jgi:hypothetical protein